MELGEPVPFREGMPCPVDGESLAAAGTSASLRECPRCRGQLAANRTLSRIVRNNGFDLLKLKPDAGRARRCPGCAAAMRIYDIEGMEIDLCPTCVLVWMDAGEWPKLGGYLENAGRERASVGPAGPPADGDRKLPVPMDAGDLFGLFFDALWDRLFRKW